MLHSISLSLLPASLYFNIPLCPVQLFHLLALSRWYSQVRYASAQIASANPEKCTLLVSTVSSETGLMVVSGNAVAKAHGEYVRTHFKNMREVAAALSGELPMTYFVARGQDLM